MLSSITARLRPRSHRPVTVTALAFVIAVAGVALARPAHAFPSFTKKEGVPCAYCHINPAGGGKRNYRGLYYKAHNKSFAGFDDVAEAKKAGVEVGPEADKKPASLTPPAPADATSPATPAVAPGTPPATQVTPVVTPGTSPTAPAVTAAAPAKPDPLAAQKAKVKAAVALNKATPTAENKRAAAIAHAELGHATMLEQSLPANRRYRLALNALYEARHLDPTNLQAAADIKTITDVYKSMNRPVPADRYANPTPAGATPVAPATPVTPPAAP